MNVARLVAGWLFLVALAAAGTYYATDQVDQRVDLSKYNLQEKFGVTKYAVASVTPPNGSVNPGPANPPSVVTQPGNPVSNNPTYQAQQTQPAPQYQQQQVTPQPQYQQQPVTPQPQYQQQPVTPQPQYQQQPGYPQRGNPQPGYQAQQRQPFPNSNQMPADFSQARTRLTELQGQAQGETEYWQQIRSSLASMHQPLRPEISAALSTLGRATAQAEQALRTGDTATAKQQMDLADRQLRILSKAKE